MVAVPTPITTATRSPDTIDGNASGHSTCRSTCRGVSPIATAHSTFASASGGRTAYITALALPSGKLLWRSPALVANAGSFAIAGSGTKRVVVAGYGFTREPDYLTVLDAGTPRGRIALRSAPERIVFARDGRLHVRTYDTDVVATLATG